jgi:2-polyprenyl-3-methyl-5-hydroxy-6-metoxy-1,4-benzoquinol methylase
MREIVLPDEVASTHEREAKQDYFDRYWVTRDFLRTDRRTMERAQLIWPRLSRRHGRALDVGCGRGLFASFLMEQGLVVDAADISPQAVDLTSERGVNAFILDLEQQGPIGMFDLIFCLEVLQQVRDPEAVLRRLTNALKPDGEIVVSVPNEFHLLRRLRVLFGQPDFGDVVDSHLKFFTPLRGENLLRRCGLEVRCRAFASIVPPQFGLVAALGRTAASMWPSGLAISSIYFAHKRTS